MGIRSTQLRSGDVFFVQDSGGIAWYSRLCQAGSDLAGRQDLVPTHCGFLFRWDPYIRNTTTHLVYNNLELCNMQRNGACVECNDPFIRINKLGNCPGIMGILRPWVVSSATTLFNPSPGYYANRAEWYFSQVLCNQLRAIGKTDYDFGYIVSNFISGLGVLTANPFMIALAKIRQQVVRDNRYVCSTWVISVLLALAAYRYKVNDMFWYGGTLPYPGPVSFGLRSIPPSSKNYETAVMLPAYNNNIVCTPWLTKNQMRGTYCVGTYGQGLLTGASQTAKLGTWW